MLPNSNAVIIAFFIILFDIYNANKLNIKSEINATITFTLKFLIDIPIKLIDSNIVKKITISTK